MIRILWMTAVLVAALPVAQRQALASEAPWCAVRNKGYDVHWDCQYDSIEACARTVVAGNRGFCNQNPWYQGPQPGRKARHHYRRY